MRVLALTPPGRFPTTIADLGAWWDAVAETGQHEMLRFSANHAWWRAVCGAGMKEFVLQPLGRLDRLRRRALWRSRNIALKEDSLAAARALEALQTPAPYTTADNYINVIAPIACYLADLNRAQAEFAIDIAYGAHVRDLKYLDSATLVRYSRQDTILSRTIVAALKECPPDLGFVALSVTGLEDLLTSLIAARHLRARNANVHISLVDHGYENFSLHAHTPALRTAGTLDSIFDSIVVSKDERDDVVPALIAALGAGRVARGYLTRASLPDLQPSAPRRVSPPPPLPTFSPEPILVTRLSGRRCYWSRCSYCGHNNKYDDRGAPAHADIPTTLDRIEAFIAAGYSRYVNFSDEALSPSMLRQLARELERRRLTLNWVCRCKIERAHDAGLFAQIAKAGCKEIQYGLETTSPRMLKLMDKHVEGIDEPRIAQAFRDMAAVGIGVHVNLIGGFPGDSLADTEGSVDFIRREFANLRSASYFISAFTLLPDTPIAQEPERFGLSEITAHGDLAQAMTYQLRSDIAETTQAVMDAIPRLDQQLADALAWSRLADGPAGTMVMMLYFGSGHGALFKARADNPFADPKAARIQAGRTDVVLPPVWQPV